ncbi:MAG TPA: OmpA family protein [Clostridiales bacterium]|nr:OmpA family protein [Clostridiales bacterium]HQP70220.1 OmpA family protein [Clostridiales bacterium]
MRMNLKKLVLTAAFLLCFAAFGRSLTGYSGLIKLIDPVTHGSGFFSVSLSTLLGPGAVDDSTIVSSSNINKYFQSTNHISANVSLGNYIDIGAKASFAIDSRDIADKNYSLTKLNNLEVGIRGSFKRTGFFRSGLYLYGLVPVLKNTGDIEDFENFREVPNDTLRYYNHRKFSDEFLFNPMASFGAKILASFGTDDFRVLMNGGYLWRTATEKEPSGQQIDILPDAFTMNAGMEYTFNEYVGMFLEWDGEMLLDKKTGDIVKTVSEEEFIHKAGGGFKFVGNKYFSATVGGFGGLAQEDTPDWQVYTGITLTGNWIDPDTDKDGILDEVDSCPTEPEDFDGFEDTDGCPEADNDKDGITDLNDKCPLVPEDLDGYQDDDGCPEDDNDGDGIKDSYDKCPNEPEDFDGYEDQDGCPEFDNDGDGIKDDTDKCPLEPEDFDGWLDSDGCPEFDNDGDGIRDESDKCPNEAESFNGFEDSDGCPDAVILKKDERIVLDNIYFKLASAELETESFETLNSLKRVFLDNPGIIVQIEGHTDSQGSDSYNLDLSRRRAGTVADYIVNVLGVSSGQVSSVGFGESKPVADNKTSKGRAQNRRIEFRVVSTGR